MIQFRVTVSNKPIVKLLGDQPVSLFVNQIEEDCERESSPGKVVGDMVCIVYQQLIADLGQTDFQANFKKFISF